MKRFNFRNLLGLVSRVSTSLHLKPVTHEYPNPTLRNPYARRSKSVRKAGKPRKRLGTPRCTPGTITYFDWLVKTLNYDRRLADGYMYAYLNGYDIKMPMPTKGFRND